MVSLLRFFKVDVLPTTLESSSIYFTKDNSTGYMTLYMTNDAGTITYRTHTRSDILNIINDFVDYTQRLYIKEHSPIMSYTSGRLTRIDYASGAYKTFTYNPNNSINEVSSVRPQFTLTKTMVYNVDGSLDRITEVIS
jgi:hypothetical protein